jgi:DNA-binding response OmpR family regulator
MQTNKTILVVEDEAQLRQMLSRALQRLGYNACTAPDVATALHLARIAGPDLILLDVDLPDGSGFALCRAIKINPDLASVPVVFATGRDTREDRQIAAQVGGVDYIVKPFDLRQLAECLRRHLPQP